MLRVAIDAMGGDHAPQVVIEGAVSAVQANKGKLEVVLCGPESLLKQELENAGYQGDSISIIDAPDVVAMDEHPTEVLRKKPNSGLVTGVALQKKGLVHASISAGNSGAMMASCLMLLGRSTDTFTRPPIACAIPTAKNRTVLVDAGANIDEKASVLVDFAIAGSVFAESYLGYENPRVALLNMGEEEKKGPVVVQEAYQQLKNTSLNFIGNVEGRGLIAGDADVIVTSGFTGNVVLKMLEGFYELHQSLFGTIDSPEGKRFAEMWDYRSTGGALLLGLNGTGVIAHGCSDARAIEQAILSASQFAETKIAENVGKKLADFKRS